VVPKERICCMALAYLDAAMFVKVSMAMDAIIESLIAKRGAEKVSVAYLCTPTDAHLCNSESVEASKANFRRAPGWQKLFLSLNPLLAKIGQYVAKNVEKPILDSDGKPIEGLNVVDSIMPEQGPNYILAKRLQHWRAMVSREAGCIVSSNIGPITATASVLSNLSFALGMKSMTYFPAMEIAYQETSNTILAALLIRDLRDPTSASHPKTPLRNPLCLMSEQPFHSGCWRGAFKMQSYGAPGMVGWMFYAFLVCPYLLGYNAYEAIGWGKVLVAALTSDWSGLLGAVGAQVTWVQHLGLMEVLHSALGMTRSNLVVTFIQIFSRVLVLSLVNPSNLGASVRKETFWIPMMIMCWSAADCLRYVFYCFNLVRDMAGYCKTVGVALKMMKVKNVEVADDPVFKIPFPLTWLRYSLFLVNYPVGVFCELMVFWKAKSVLTAPMFTASADPSSLSAWALSTLQFLLRSMGATSETKSYGVVLFLYFLGLPFLYLTLLTTRRKQLAPPAKAAKASDKKTK